MKPVSATLLGHMMVLLVSARLRGLKSHLINISKQLTFDQEVRQREGLLKLRIMYTV